MATEYRAERQRFNEFIFWSFCFVVFSKIVWYNIAAYIALEDRRDYQLYANSIWVLAQILVYMPIAIQILRQFTGAVAFWVLATAPFFMVGLWYGQINFFVVNDIVRYTIPVGFLLFGLWAVKNVPVRTMITAIVTSLLVCVIVRTIFHLVLSDTVMRYGEPWEVLLPILLVAMAYRVKGWQYATVLACIIVIVVSYAFGLTRSTLLGTAIAASVVGLIAVLGLRKRPFENFKMGVAAAFAICAALLPVVLPASTFDRLNMAAAIEDTDQQLVSEMFGGGEEGKASVAIAPGVAEPGATTPAGKMTRGEPPLTPPVEPIEASQDERIQSAIERYEQTVASGGKGMDVRLAEIDLFLQLMNRDWVRFLLGAGTGTYVAIHLPWSEGSFMVRGAHNTPVALLYRHGVILGALLFLFVAFYGLFTNMRQLIHAKSPDWRMLLTALIGYRVAAVAMAQVHQGLFDDPIIFFAIAIAINLPIVGASSDSRDAPPYGPYRARVSIKSSTGLRV